MSVILVIIISGCSGEGKPITSFQGSIQSIGSNEILVDCSNVVNRNEKGDIDLKGYIFTVKFNENSKVIAENNEQISIKNLSQNQEIEVILASTKDIGESNQSRIGVAKEVRILEANSFDKKVTKVSMDGLVNNTSVKTDIKKIVESINKIKSYQSENIPVYHSTPPPRWAINLNMMDNKHIIVYEDYDGKTKISNWNKSYIFDKTISQRILEDNGLQILYP